jgi:hypothetical protein
LATSAGWVSVVDVASDLLTTAIAGATGVGGVTLGALLNRQNERRARADRLLVDALNDAVGAIAEVADSRGARGQSRYASAISRIGLHGSPSAVKAFRRFQDDAETGTQDGRSRLLDAVQVARRELGQAPVDNADLAILLFGPGEASTERRPWPAEPAGNP